MKKAKDTKTPEKGKEQDPAVTPEVARVVLQKEESDFTPEMINELLKKQAEKDLKRARELRDIIDALLNSEGYVMVPVFTWFGTKFWSECQVVKRQG